MTDESNASPVGAPLSVGFVGLGMMGTQVSTRLLEAGYHLVVHNRTRDKATPLLARGAEWASSPAALASRVPGGIVFLMLTNDEAVRRELFDPEGVVAGASKGTLAVGDQRGDQDFSAVVEFERARLRPSGPKPKTG